METFTLLICIFGGLMIFIFACAFAYHKQSQDYLAALAADGEPKSKPDDIEKSDKNEETVQTSDDSKLPKTPQSTPTNLTVTQQTSPYPAFHSDNFHNLAQSRNLMPQPYPVSNFNQRMPMPLNNGSNGSQSNPPPSYVVAFTPTKNE